VFSGYLQLLTMDKAHTPSDPESMHMFRDASMMCTQSWYLDIEIRIRTCKEPGDVVMGRCDGRGAGWSAETGR
jgi:hypothetical protein